VINTGGDKVHPQEVEDILLAYPGGTDGPRSSASDRDLGGSAWWPWSRPDSATWTAGKASAVRQRLAAKRCPGGILRRPCRAPDGKLGWLPRPPHRFRRMPRGR